jgi:hypothetical protein
MNFIEQLSAVALLADFFLGVTVGIVGGAVHGSLHEDRRGTLLGAAPDPLSAGARRMLGVYTRDDDGYLRRLLSGDSQVPGDGGDEQRSDGSGAQGKGPER